MAFTHLHNHTEHSALDGLNRIASVCSTASALGQTAMAITDHGSLAGAYRFQKAALATGIKPIIGIEIYMAIGSRFERNSEIIERDDDDAADDADEGAGKDKVKRYMHLTLLARNETGWKNLLALHNKAEESYWYKPRIDFDLLKEHGEGLIVLTGCLAGPVAGPMARASVLEERGDTDGAARFEKEARTNLDTLIDCVGKEHVFLEIMYHGIAAEKRVLTRLKNLSKETGIPLVATNDCHYEHEEDARHHDGFLAVGVGRGLDDPNRFRFNGSGYHVKSEEEMLAVFPGNDVWAAACAQSQVVADLCDDKVIPDPHMRLPRYPLPEGYTDSNTYLYDLVKTGAKERYGSLTTEVKERLRTELDVIRRMGFPDYFLIVWDVISWCRSDAPVDYTNPDAPRKKPILVGPGRGSAAGSCVSYCLKIVGIDPLENNLLFERFLEEGRAGMPDIDVDFEQGRRDEVFAYLGYRWGKGNVAHIGTFGVALSKAAIKDAARILKPSGNDKASRDRATALMRLGDKLSGLVPDNGGKAYSFAQLDDTADQSGQAFRDLVAEAGQDAQDILELARGFEGITKNESIHACGFVVSPEPLDELVPLRWASHAADADPTAPRVICWDGGQVEEYGFLKMDVLGLMNLDIVSVALDNIKDTTGQVLSMDDIPHPNTTDDPKVDAAFALVAAGNTSGVFQMDGAGMIKVAQDVVPETLNDVSAILALFRPGPLAAKIPDRYAARKNGRETVDYDMFTADKTEQEWISTVLNTTYGLFVYQEQLMRLGTVIAGFDAGQRSTLRRAVGKKKKSEMDKVGQMLEEGAEQEFFDEDGNLISPKFSTKTAAHVFELMQGSASYLFNASHSAAYAQLAYVTAYLKANWPVEYAAAILAVADKEDKRLTALASLREDGIVVEAPDVNRSKARTAPVDGKVLIGLAEVKGVGAAGNHIEAERERGGAFRDMHDLLNRVTVPGDKGAPMKLPVTAVHGLIEAGALDSFGPRLGQVMILRAARPTPLAPLDAEWSDVERSTRQRSRLGVALGIHPLTSLKDVLNGWTTPVVYDPDTGESYGMPVKPLHKISDINGHPAVTVGVISAWSEKGYSGGRRANFSLESSRVTVNGVIWDRTLSRLRRNGSVPKVGDVVAVSGKVSVRTTVVGDEETGTQETITTKELNIGEIWPVEHETEPRVDLPGNVFDFAAAYHRLRATELPKPEPKTRTRKTPAAPVVAAPEPAPVPGSDTDADDALAGVTDLNSRRRAGNGAWAAVELGEYELNLNGDAVDGDPDVIYRHRAEMLPGGRKPGTVYRCVSPGGDRITVLIPGGSVSAETLLAEAKLVGDADDRWVDVPTKTNYAWFRLAPATRKKAGPMAMTEAAA